MGEGIEVGLLELFFVKCARAKVSRLALLIKCHARHSAEFEGTGIEQSAHSSRSII